MAVSPSRLAPAAAPRTETHRTLAVDDVIVFEHHDAGFRLVSAAGRRAGWVGIVELSSDDDGLVGSAWERGSIERQDGPAPSHVAGPYYAAHAVAVPVGERHVVVFGSAEPIIGSEIEFVGRAAVEVDDARGVSADKLLADELEVVQALRDLMAYRPLTIRDTALHVAQVAARALSCEVAVVRLSVGDGIFIEGLDLRSAEALPRPDPAGHLSSVPARAIVAQVAEPDPDLFGVDVVSHLVLPLPGSIPGALALGHTAEGARGFTSLCQRIGRAIAESSELLLDQASTREALSGERDALAGLVREDSLTGVASRRTWEDQVSRWRANVTHPDAYVVSCDVDGLKEVNDRYGHAAGDAVIRGAADLLRSCIREADLLARVGGDEFVILLAPADAAVAERVVRRIRRAEARRRVTEHQLPVRLSVGGAPVVAGDLEAAHCASDDRMYANKRRRRSQDKRRTVARARLAPGSSVVRRP
jgi:diguanylate cyclase (GGDEF)-like protein